MQRAVLRVCVESEGLQTQIRSEVKARRQENRIKPSNQTKEKQKIKLETYKTIQTHHEPQDYDSSYGSLTD